MKLTGVLTVAVALMAILLPTAGGVSARSAVGTHDHADATRTLASSAVPTVKTLDDLFAEVAQKVPAFGGMFVGKDGVLQVYLTDLTQRDAAAREIGRVFGSTRLRGGINVLQGRYGFGQLKSWHDRQRLKSLALPGVILTGIDEAKNRLQVGVQNGAAAAKVKSELDTLNVPREAVEIVEVKPIRQLAGSTLRDTRRPLEGGLQICGGTKCFCTLGFLAVRQTTAGFVTASHCTQKRGGVEGTVFQQAVKSGDANQIGVEAVDPPYSSGGGCPSGRVCRMSDAAFVRRDGGPKQTTPRADADFGHIAAPNFNSVSVGKEQFHIEDFDLSPFEGEVVAKVGRTTGLTEGEITDTCDDMNVANTNVTLLCQDRVAATSAGGDSGSPVFSWNSATLPPGAQPPAKLYGTLWGGPTDGSAFDFSPILAVDAELGISYSGLYPQAGSPNSHPEVKIRTPIDGATVGYGGLNNVIFQADIVDYEGCCADVVWSSDKDGSIGHGRTLDTVLSSPGTRHVTVWVKDNGGSTAVDKITLNVVASPPVVSIVKPAQGQTLYMGYPYVFEGKSFDANEFGLQLSCWALKWTSSKPGDPSAPFGCAPVMTFSTTGPRTITLTGKDPTGLIAFDTASVNVVAAPPNSPPVVTILAPTDGTYFAESDPVWATLKATASDPDLENPLTYTWMLKYGNSQKILGTGTMTNGQTITVPWKPHDLPFACGGWPVKVVLGVKDADGMTGSDTVGAYIADPVC